MKAVQQQVARVLLAIGAVAFALGGVVKNDARADEESLPGDAAPSTRSEPSIVRLDAIDPDALVVVQRLLAIRGFDPGPVDGKVRPELDGALRSFASSQGLEAATVSGFVVAGTLNALGAGLEVAVRWGSNEPRAPELTSAECYRVNYALAARGYRAGESLPSAVDAATVDALRRFQKDTGHPVQLGNFVARRWLFILGVATPESCPPAGSLPASLPRGEGH